MGQFYSGEINVINKLLVRFALIWVLFSIMIAGCQPNSIQSTTKVETIATETTLKIVVIPVLDALPMYVAQKEGLFKSRGLNVEFIPVASGAERDQLIASGQADGMLNELLSTILFNKERIQVQVVRYARAATSDSPLFKILASAKSGITKPEQLKDVEIGISEGTIIAYITDRLLQKSGLKPSEIKTIGVPKIPERLSLLNSGQLKAAVLPDPTSSLAIQQGAVAIMDDTLSPELSFSTLSFRKQVIDEHPTAIKAFVAAIEEATRMINEDMTQIKWIPVLSDLKLVPAPLLKTYKIPKFVTAGVPSQTQFLDVLDWGKGKGIIKTDISYQDSVNPSFLP